MRRIVLQSGEKLTKDMLNRKSAFDEHAIESAARIIENVRKDGDLALKAYTLEFDGVSLESFRVPDSAYEAALHLDTNLVIAMVHANEQITKFHERQKQQSWFFARQDGAIVGARITPLDSVGVYVPGGRALYPSTLLMNAIPAKVAGVKRIVCMTPPNKDGKVDPAILYAAQLAGVTEMYT
ncbi:MAG: histidinol dehydrogenase, partial [Eggerthellaceae bacterium]|nr:histidinol dehydrogenase [Eggerthellaceae bacterium]